MQHEDIQLTESIATLTVEGINYQYISLPRLEELGLGTIRDLPYSIKILLESAVRNWDGKFITNEHIYALANWCSYDATEVPFKPTRIILQDFTGVPAIVDLASMRDEVASRGGNPTSVNPMIPVDLVIDHSVIIEHAGDRYAFSRNVELEYERNKERYEFVKWAQKSFTNFNVVPPSNGIVHQVNLEYLASSVRTEQRDNNYWLFPDSLVGTDSHTPMINGIGTVAWGVGGIEAEAAMLGQPLYFVMPEVIGIRLKGSLREGVTATDLALTVTSILRKKGVVGKFVEFFGEGVRDISVPDRATIANMAPEYGATMSMFPVDDRTLDYLKETGRGKIVPLAEAYWKAQGMFNLGDEPPAYTEVLELDLDTIAATVSGPKRPQDTIPLPKMKEAFDTVLRKPMEEGGYGADDNTVNTALKEGAVVLASITSCTNTSNPSVMVAAGLLAKKAVEKGLLPPSYVKTTLSPGSRVVATYLEKAGLLQGLEHLGFYIDGYGCAACCGNTGALVDGIEQMIQQDHLVVASILSGNRNFEGRIHPLIRANYLASPPLVVAFALAGRVNINMEIEPLGVGNDGEPVFLKDIWPSSKEIERIISETIDETVFKGEYDRIDSNEKWATINSSEGLLYDWDDTSTYIQKAPYFEAVSTTTSPLGNLKEMLSLAILGDSITTDHISPAGHIPIQSEAGIFLQSQGVEVREFNNYGARRGNHKVMERGTFANIRLRNRMANGKEGGYTKHLPTEEIVSMFEAASRYQKDGRNLLIIAGKEYGTGSSRDWAAKGTTLLGVKVILAESFERIHRSNLVGMGVLPVQFLEGMTANSLSLDGTETYSIHGLTEKTFIPRQRAEMQAVRHDGTIVSFPIEIRIDNAIEREYYMNGGILPTVMEKLLSNQ
ncbi:aconitate hydratase AcnA [Sporosarcina saromensis]|uniref:Aconitate hydratase n=1 Tax=Sporosarcina saromensis TaxID=359365 RepID=A0ABU4G9L3_9BACL|nr:aconitate hydratase AcnA [Sporosarcina saromensis]MDW0113018.1 aconitate hydratase AcnA [Sporosarcina saromensis]